MEPIPYRIDLVPGEIVNELMEEFAAWAPGYEAEHDIRLTNDGWDQLFEQFIGYYDIVRIRIWRVNEFGDQEAEDIFFYKPKKLMKSFRAAGRRF